MKTIIMTIFLCLSSLVTAKAIDVLDIENHPQKYFPQLTVSMGNQSAQYYGSDSSESGIVFQKEESKKLEGEIPLSGYIFAKEFVESFRIPKTVANKKTSSEFVKIFAEKNAGKMVDYLLHINEKKRTAQNDKEIEIITKKIAELNTQDSPESTPYFSTGYIELKSPKDNSERYYIKISDIKKESLTLNADKTKITMLKNISIYSFQNVLSSLNFGDIEKGSNDDVLYNRLEKTNLSLCGLECSLGPMKDLSSMALNVGRIVSFEAQGNSKIENMEDFNKYVLAQQWCILNEFSKACHAQALDNEIKDLSENETILQLILKHKSKEELCKFVQK